MKKINLYIIILSVLFIASCKKSETAAAGKYFELIDNDYSFKSEMGAYENYFTGHDGFQSLQMRKSGLYSDSRMSAFSGYTKDNLHDPERRKYFFINDLSAYDYHLLSPDEQYSFLRKNMGTEVNFKYMEGGDMPSYDIPLYIPKEINVDTTLSGIHQIIYSKIGEFKADSKLYYNADSENKNGLLVILSYRGHSLNTSFDDIENNNQDFGQLKKFLYMPNDNGVLEFPDGFFNELPDGALFTLHIERSTYSTFNLGEDSHSLKGSASYSISLALKR